MFWKTKSPTFTYRQPTHRADDTAGMLQELHEVGFVLVPGMLTAEEVTASRAAIDRLVPQPTDTIVSGLDHYKCVFNRDPFWVPYLDRPGIIELAEAAMGRDCHVIGQTAWRCAPGFYGVGVHADHVVVELPEEWATDPRFVLPMQICTVHYFLNDITEELCPTCVIAGSHRSGRYPQKQRETTWQGKAAEPVLCKAGDALFFRSELWHSGSINRTKDQTRYLLQVHYARRMVTQKFTPYMTWRFNPEVLAVCSQRQRRLLGDHRPGAYD